MKHILLLICFWLLAKPVYSQHEKETSTFTEVGHHCLFKEKSLTVGIASPYSFELRTLGVNARIYYNIGESICFGPEYAYFKTDETEVVDFDFVGHYIFETPWVGIYPLIGINYTIETELIHQETLADIGLVFGAGMHRNFEKFTAFVEYSSVELGIVDQFVNIGIMYNFN